MKYNTFLDENVSKILNYINNYVIIAFKTYNNLIKTINYKTKKVVNEPCIDFNLKYGLCLYLFIAVNYFTLEK